MKKLLKIILIILLIVVVLAAALFAVLTITEFKPDDVTDVGVVSGQKMSNSSPVIGEEYSVLSWNIGYAGLGEGSDFFMDGGTEVAAADEATVNKYLQGIYDTIYSEENASDIYMLQEVDTNSTRTYGINEREFLAKYNSSYALNHSCPFVPYPLPPIGRVNAGLMTTSVFDIESAERISLPCPFSWPLSTANLKRCLLVSYLPIEGSDAKLVLVDLHLEAYDDGEGKIAQTKQLREFIDNEYQKGNYVIAAGDFNQVFPKSLELYPDTHTDLWQPGELSTDILPAGWSFAYDASVPTCRLLNQPYDPADTENTQYYVIDGFILSPNIELVNVNTLDEGFANSDHNPVRLQFKLN